MDVKIHTKSITGSGGTKEGEKPGAQFSAILEIDGTLYDKIGNVRVNQGATEITSLLVRLYPSTLVTVNHTVESWEALCERAYE